MGVFVEKEPVDLGPPYEECCACGKQTEFWYTEHDVPLCPSCALVLDETDIPSKILWIERSERKHEKERV